MVRRRVKLLWRAFRWNAVWVFLSGAAAYALAEWAISSAR